MKNLLAPIFLAGLLFFAGCAGQQGLQAPLREEEPGTVQDWNWQIQDYKNRVVGQFIPDWVYYYYEGNIAALENLPEYRDYYVFVSVNTGTNFAALSQWNASFSPELDFARLAAVRIENRFLNAAARYPDDEYGSYFEAMIRAASDAQWEGASRKDDFWLYRSFPKTDGTSSGTDGYDFLILVIIRKDMLEQQIKTVLSNVNPDTPLSRDQRSAVSRVQDHFFDGF